MENNIANSVSINTLLRGVKPTNKPLFPISSHQKEQLFDSEKLKSLLSQGGKITYENFAYSKKIEGESFEQTVQNFGGGLSLGGSGSYGMASFSGSVSAEFNTSSTETRQMKFAQIRKIAQYARISLPSPLMREDLRNLLSENVKQMIDGIDNLTDAKEFVNYFGPFYISSANLGALLTISSTEISTDSNKTMDLSTELTAELSYMGGSGNTSANFKMGFNQSKRNSSLNYTLAAMGGDPSLILAGDEQEWIKSSKSNLSCVDVSLSTIENLAIKNSSAEKFLKMATEEYFSACQSDLKKLVDLQNISKSNNSKKIYPYAVPIDGDFGNLTIIATQNYLTSLNYYSGGVDGYFGTETAKALQKWLLDKGYSIYVVDGIFGENSNKALQKFLNSQNCNAGAEDGIFGTQSIRAWQTYLSKLN
jgi:hypothetical protein